MLRVTLLFIATAAVASACGGRSSSSSPATPTTPAAPLADPKNETLGGLAVGDTAAAAEKLLGPPASKAEPWTMEATGDVVADWSWSSGEKITMAQGASGQSIYAITITSPSKLRTSRGIGVGSARAEVEEAYKGTQTGAEGEVAPTPEQILVGTLYEGTSFRFVDGKVSEISVGGGAE